MPGFGQFVSLLKRVGDMCYDFSTGETLSYIQRIWMGKENTRMSQSISGDPKCGTWLIILLGSSSH